MARESPLFVKTFDLLAYLLPVVEKFPRSQRALMGQRIQGIGFGLLDLLLSARKCSIEERPDLLRQADVELDKLRYTVRLCHAIDLLGQNQYRHAAGLLAEVGKLLGTWIKGYNE
jgi:hypothetical protein